MNTTVTELHLEHNQLGEDGGQAIASAWSVNTTLTNLYLRNNQLGEDGGQEIASEREYHAD